MSFDICLDILRLREGCNDDMQQPRPHLVTAGIGQCRRQKAMASMATGESRRSSAFSAFLAILRTFRCAMVILLGLSLILAPAPLGLGQTTQQQQEQQQRDQQQREEQQRQREAEQREQQAREQQQREEQQREQQARDQQQREQQQRQREAEQREQQAREQQQREEQQREQQARDQQQREEQQRQHEAEQREHQAREQQQREEQGAQRQMSASPLNSASPSSPSANSSVRVSTPTEGQVPGGTSRQQQTAASGSTAGRTDGGAKRGQGIALPVSDLSRGICEHGPCAEPGSKPVQPEVNAKLCKNGNCPICAPGQSLGKDNACVAAKVGNGTPALAKPATIPQTCAAGQVWNGSQCAPTGAQQCGPGQSLASPSCQVACAAATGGAQNYIALLRMARQDKDQACTENPNGTECQQAASTYNIRLNEYRNFLAGVPSACSGLPDPISI